MSPSNRVTLGMIGTGGMGVTDMRNFLGFADVQVIALCDTDRRHLDTAQIVLREHYGGSAEAFRTQDFRELIARDDIDAVAVATPPHTHAMAGIAALRAGKDLYGEKPMARTIRDCRLLAETAVRHGRVFQHGTQSRSFPPIRKALERVRNGRLGRIERVLIGIPTGPVGPADDPAPVPDGLNYDQWLGPAPWRPYLPNCTHANFRYVQDFSAGVITDLGVHYIDVAQWGCGHDDTGPVRISGDGQYPHSGAWDTPTAVNLELEFADGIVYDFSTRHPTGVRFVGSDGWLYIPMNIPVPEKPLEWSDPRIADSALQPGETRLYRSTNHWRNFIDCVKSRQPTATTAEIAVRSTTIPHLGCIAMASGTAFRWDPGAERITDKPELNAMLDRPKRSPWGDYV